MRLTSRGLAGAVSIALILSGGCSEGRGGGLLSLGQPADSFVIGEAGEGTCRIDYQSQLLAVDGETGRVLWATEVPWAPLGAITASGSRLFVGAASLSDGSPSVLAVQQADGLPLWQRFVDDAYGAARPLVTMESALIAVDGERVLALAHSTGKTLWSSKVGRDVSLVAFEDSVIVGSDGGLRSLDSSSGAIRWHVDAVGGSGSLFLSGGGLVVASTGEGELLGVDARRGEVAWRLPAEAERFWSRLVGVVDGVAVVAGGVEADPLTGGGLAEDLAGVDVTAGQFRWRHRLVGSSDRVVLADDLTFDVSATAVVARATSTGEERWRLEGRQVGRVTRPEPALVLVSEPVPDNSSSLSLHRLDVATGSPIWTARVEAASITEAVSFGDRFVIGTASGGEPGTSGSNGTMMLVRSSDGATVWRTETRDAVAAPPIAIGGRVLALPGDQPLFCD